MVNKFNIIACVNDNLSLGLGNKLLYHIKSDMANFKRLTTDNIVIMGRETFESLPNKSVLPNRTNIIISHDKYYQVDGAIVVNSISEAIERCENSFLKHKKKFVIGGASIYKQFLEANLVDKVFLTEVNDNIEGDVKFPKLLDDNWNIVFQTDWINDCDSELQYRYKLLEKKNDVTYIRRNF